jgi:TolA-binding protein
MDRHFFGAARISIWMSGLLIGTTLVAIFGQQYVQAQAPAPLKADDKSAILLNSAHRAYNDKQFNVAADRYREYLKTYAGTKQAVDARFGLSLALLEAPQKDFKTASEMLGQVVGVTDFVDRPLAHYYLGLAYRGLGHDAMQQSIAKPQEAAKYHETAKQQFQQAAKYFGEALPLFTARVTTPPPADATELPTDLEWVARSRCDQAEMLLRLDKPKEALDAVAPLVLQPAWAKSRYRPTGQYYHGYAAYLLKDYLIAVRSLTPLAPFSDPVFGAHAQYLLARTHHLAGDRAESVKLYEAVIAGYEKQKAAAQQALKNNVAMQESPEEKVRLEELVKAPPDYVGRAGLYWGVLLYEEQKFADALTRFASFAQAYPQSPLLAEAQLRQGFCQVELRQYTEAQKTLDPLTKHATLADQALLWIARAQVGAADPNQAQPYTQALNGAMDRLKQASDKAQQAIAQEPEAKRRKADVLVELADVQQLAKQFASAVTTYQQVIKENYAADRTEEILQRLATAMHLAGQYDPSDQMCESFKQTYPKSTLLPAMLFRSAENAYVRAAAIEPDVPRSKNPEPVRWFGEAIKRYEAVIDKYPEFVYVPLARYRQGLAHYRLGQNAEAIAALAKIQQADQQGELALVSYFYADALLRTMPASTANDALSVARQLQQFGEAIKLLENFVGAQGASPQAPAALVKLGYCYQHVAVQIADPNERNKTFGSARQAYEKVLQQFAKDPQMPVAAFERATCMAEQGDAGGALNELKKFRDAPLSGAPIAPLAWLRQATLLRSQNKAAEAVDVMKECRSRFEGDVLKDPARAAWAPLLQYNHGLAVKETGKLADARGIFEDVVKRFGSTPEASDAAWRAGQCRKEEAWAAVVTARVVLAKPDAKPEELNAARQQIDASAKNLTEAAQYLVSQAGKPPSGSESHQRLLYGAAWTYQALADLEIEAARNKLLDEAIKKQKEELAKQGVGVMGVPQSRILEIAITAIPIQPAEQLAREQYKTLIATAAAAPLAVQARLELAEMLARRQEYDPAIALLNDGLDQEPSPEVEEQLRLRLGTCLAEKGQPGVAFDQFVVVAGNLKSPWAAEARYRAGECQMARQDWAKAIEQWLPFRDQQPLQNVPGLSDRVLLRLGHAQAHAGQWDASRQTLETLIGRFGQSPWRVEARYGIGWARQNQKQYDQAIADYAQVINETASELAAKSQFQLALCRLEQKRLPEAANALLVVPFTYDYPEYSALALLEASRVFVEMQQPQQATRLLQRVVKDYSGSEWAKTAQQRLSELQTGKKG